MLVGEGALLCQTIRYCITLLCTVCYCEHLWDSMNEVNLTPLCVASTTAVSLTSGAHEPAKGRQAHTLLLTYVYKDMIRSGLAQEMYITIQGIL